MKRQERGIPLPASASPGCCLGDRWGHGSTEHLWGPLARCPPQIPGTPQTRRLRAPSLPSSRRDLRPPPAPAKRPTALQAVRRPGDAGSGYGGPCPSRAPVSTSSWGRGFSSWKNPISQKKPESVGAANRPCTTHPSTPTPAPATQVQSCPRAFAPAMRPLLPRILACFRTQPKCNPLRKALPDHRSPQQSPPCADTVWTWLSSHMP